MSTKEFKDRVSPKSSDDKDLEKKNQPLPVYEEEDEWDEWYDECFIENENIKRNKRIKINRRKSEQ
tara:strand:- start:343 stop:540 length:198 start_codon:yes stop_codon:yes gene_type:complete